MGEICPINNTEKLLLATDGSQFNEGAIREAIRLAKKCSSKLSAISVIETNSEYEAIAPQLLEKSEKKAREHLESVKAQAKKEGVDCSTSILEGEDSYHYIADEAAKNKASMIIMGRRLPDRSQAARHGKYGFPRDRTCALQCACRAARSNR